MRRQIVELARSGPYKLPTSLADVHIDAWTTGTFRRGRSRHADLESHARTDVIKLAAAISQTFGADDVIAVGAAINSELGRPRDCPDWHYRQLTARVEVTVTAEAARAAAEHRNDRARVARLHDLQAGLYSNPGLLVIDHLDRNPGAVPDLKLITDYYKLAGHLQEAGEWWGSLMAAWDEVVRSSPKQRTEIMESLRKAIFDLDPQLAARHSLPRPPGD